MYYGKVWTFMDALPVNALILSPMKVAAACFWRDGVALASEASHSPLWPAAKALQNKLSAGRRSWSDFC